MFAMVEIADPYGLEAHVERCGKPRVTGSRMTANVAIMIRRLV